MSGIPFDFALLRSGRTVGVLLNHHNKALEAALDIDSSSARIEVQCLLQAVLQVNRVYLFTHPEQLLSDEQQARFTALFERRLSGEPIAYLLGEREFYGLTFKVSPATLIPRPETELLVELALQRIPQQGTCRVLDLGTGSGAIALSIAHARPNAEVVAVDASTAALEVAQFNAQRLNLGNVRLLHSDWFGALQDERFDIIVSNPPYIAADDAHLTQGDVRFEPPSALVSGADGLDDIRRICAQAKTHLNVNGWLLFEHGYDQAAQVCALLQQAGFAGIFSARDLAGVERVSGGT
jgi:release factor glutamine methyltransferase